MYRVLFGPYPQGVIKKIKNLRLEYSLDLRHHKKIKNLCIEYSLDLRPKTSACVCARVSVCL